MAETPAAFDEAFQRRKKTIVIIGAVLVILLGGILITGQTSGLLSRVKTPSPTIVAVITTLPPTTTAPPTATS